MDRLWRQGESGKNRVVHGAGGVGEAEVAPRVAICQLQVIEAEQREQAWKS